MTENHQNWNTVYINIKSKYQYLPAIENEVNMVPDPLTQPGYVVIVNTILVRALFSADLQSTAFRPRIMDLNIRIWISSGINHKSA